MNYKTIVGITLLLVLSSSAIANKEEYQEKPRKNIFEIPLPEQYLVYKRGQIQERSARGNYMILRNKDNNILILIASTQPLNSRYAPRNRFEQEHFLQIARHLFLEYVGFNIPFEIFEEQQVELPFEYSYYPVLHMRVKFSDTFEEPDIITRFNYTDGETLVVMMGLPSKGFHNVPQIFRSFSGEYREMIEELQRWIDRGGWLEGALPF